MMRFDFDEEMQELAFEFHFMFEDIIPTNMIPSNETLAGLKAKVKRCLKEEKNLLPELYVFHYSADY